jgi:choline kinase/phosphatidylglycerophosphate synthase
LDSGATDTAGGKLFAVVIAGGEATRLRPYSEEMPKALMELAPGVTIIDFIVSQLREVGVEDILVVARPEHRSFFEERLEGVAKVGVVEGNDLGNLSSLAAALDIVGPHRILLAMSDHVFELDILRRLVDGDDGSKKILLCLDARPNHRDLREGMRVQASAQEVLHVGKMIPPQSGVDTGLFILQPEAQELVSALNAEKAGKATISDLVNCLAAKGAAGFVDVSGKLWFDIDTSEDLLVARRRYWDIVRRGLHKPTDGPVSRWLNRPVSTRLTIFLFRHVPSVTPNLLTVASFLIATAAALLFVSGQLVIGALLVHLSSILDGTDGELARLRSSLSAFGGLLDSVLDRLADILLVLTLGFLLPSAPINFALTVMAVFGVVLVSYVSQLTKGYGQIARLRVEFPWATRDVRLFTITVGGLALQPVLPLVFCASAPLIFAARVLAKARTLQEGPARVNGPSVISARDPEPRIVKDRPVGGSHEIRGNIESLLANLLKVAVALVILQLMQGAVEGLNQSIGTYLPAPVDIDLVLDLARLVVLAYFGYRVLLSARFFVNMATDFVVAKVQITQGMYARVTTDILYLVILLISWWIISPLLARLPEIGSFLRMPVNLVFLIFIVLLLYDLGRIMNRALRGLWEETIAHLTEWLSKYLRVRSDETAAAESHHID